MINIGYPPCLGPPTCIINDASCCQGLKGAAFSPRRAACSASRGDDTRGRRGTRRRPKKCSEKVAP